MKRKITLIGMICILIILILILALWNKNKMGKLYETYRYPNEDFFGKELYAEINHECSGYESDVGNRVVNKGVEVLGYAGTEQESKAELGDVGALDRYYYFDNKNVVSQQGTVQFITCKISGNEGHVWVVYTRNGYDENGTPISISSDILSLWYIEKRGDDWFVVQIREAP